MLYDVTIDGKNYRLDLNRAEGRWSCRLDGHELEVDAVLARPTFFPFASGTWLMKSSPNEWRTICICGWAARGSQRKCAIRAHCAAAREPETIRDRER